MTIKVPTWLVVLGLGIVFGPFIISCLLAIVCCILK